MRIFETEDSFQVPTYKKLPLALVKGEGAYVWDHDGNRYLDFYGGHCVAILGHCPPPVVKAIQKQAETMLFYSNLVYSDIRAEATEVLTSFAPEGLKKAFFCNSGTEANETALKLARKITTKSGVVATIGGFHGRTLGSLAVTWGKKYHEGYEAVLPHTHFIPFGDADALQSLLSENPDIAAFILEPIQSIAGVTQAEADYYRKVRTYCDQYGVMLIFDEVQTGVGRTGTFSISEAYGMHPDMITLAKSLGAGIPVGAVLVSEAISETIQIEDQGTTFGGGMVAMAAVSATLKHIRDEKLMLNAPKIFRHLQTELADYPVRLRGRGCLIGLEMDIPVAPMVAALRKNGVLTGGSADPKVMRLMPPLNTQPSDIAVFAQAFHTAYASVSMPVSSLS
ncbi:MAG: aspartate aminotransferase family protein [Bacteroidetes Order II. Incertae sedis bacterium]|nr:aspartate aminotransferase family protein [Bacteroidetes Order II. bacterium]